MHLAFLNSRLVLPRFAYLILYVLCPCQFLLSIWDARMLQNAYRTRVRRVRDAAACASSFFFFFFFLRFTTRANARGIGLIRANSGRIGPYRQQPPMPTLIDRFKLKFKKKKKRCETHHLAEIIIKGAKCTIWTKTTKPYIIFSLQLSHFSLLTSHLQLSLTLVPHLYAPRHDSLPLLSVSPLSHNLTLTLTQSHSHPHRPGDPLSSLKLRYQSQAFNLSFS